MTTQDLLPLAVATPLAVAVILGAAGAVLPRKVLDVVSVSVVLGVTAVGVLLVGANSRGPVVGWQGGWRPTQSVSVGIALVGDRLAGGIVAFVGVLALAALTFTWRYFEDVEGVFHALVLGFVAGMVGFALAGDLFTMFVFFELMGAAAFALTGMHTEEKESLQGGLTFGLLNSLGAYAALVGVGLLYARTGALNLAQMGAALEGRPGDVLVTTAAGLVMTAWLTKAALVPFHFWLADAHAVAPSPVCVLFSGIMVELGLYGVLRLHSVVFSAALPATGTHLVLLVGGAVTAAVGAVMCLSQQHVKRMLAFSTIAHVGLFAIGASILNDGGVAGAEIYALAHGGVKGALFLCAGILLQRYRSLSESVLHGQGRDIKIVGAIWLVAGLALAGIPPFGTWLGKSFIEDAAAKAGAGWVLPLAVVVSGLTGAAVLRVGLRVFLGWGAPATPQGGAEQEGEQESGEDQEEPPGGLSWAMRVPPVLLLAFGLVVGVVPGLRSGAAEAAHCLLDRAAYQASVLHFATGGSTASPAPAVTTAGILAGLTGTLIAIALAVTATRATAPSDTARKVLVAPIAGLRRLHSGHLGDYTAWLIVGIALLVLTFTGAR